MPVTKPLSKPFKIQKRISLSLIISFSEISLSNQSDELDSGAFIKTSFE